MTKPVGNQTEYTQDIADEICMRIAGGESLSSICKEDRMPAKSTVCLWVLDDREGFAEQYDVSRRLQAQLMADEIIDIADESTNDYMVRQSKSGEEYETANPEVIGRSRLRVDTRKWYLSKVLPKIYGDKVTTEHTGSINLSGMTDEQINAQIAAVLANANSR